MTYEAEPRALITAAYTSTPRIVMASFRASHRQKLIIRTLMGLAMVAVGLVANSPVVAISGVLFLALMEYRTRRALAPSLRGPRDLVVKVSEDTYAIDGPDGHSHRDWSTFQSVRRVGRFWVMRVDGTRALAIPQSVFDEQQTAAFVDLLKRKGLLAE